MSNKFQLTTAALMVFGAGFLVGCGKSTTAESASGPSAEGAAYRLASEPAGAKGVKEARDDGGNNDQEITLVGRIGGDANPWIEGQAAFLIVDSALKPCNEKDDEGCKTPWDYCCDAGDLPANKAMVRVVDAQGKTLATGAKTLLGIKELQTVVIQGRAKRDEAGNLTVLADGVFVRK